MKKILPLFSYLFHPIFIPVLATTFYYFISNKYSDYQQFYINVLQVLILTVFIPISFFYLLISFKKIDSIMVSNVAQRKLPLLMQIILIIILIRLNINKESCPELYFCFIGSLISSAVALVLVFFKIKASMHMLGMASLTVFVVACCLHFQVKTIWLVTLLITLNGLVATSRLYMKAHTNLELILGFLIGLIPQLFMLNFWL